MLVHDQFPSHLPVPFNAFKAIVLLEYIYLNCRWVFHRFPGRYHYSGGSRGGGVRRLPETLLHPLNSRQFLQKKSCISFKIRNLCITFLVKIGSLETLFLILETTLSLWKRRSHKSGITIIVITRYLLVLNGSFKSFSNVHVSYTYHKYDLLKRHVIQDKYIQYGDLKHFYNAR